MKRRITALVLLLALASAACSSDSSDDGLATLNQSDADADAAAVSDDEGSDAELDREEAILAFTECLRGEGFDISDPEFDDDGNLRMRSLFEAGEEAAGFDREEMRAGMDACSEHLEGIAQQFDRADRAEMEDRLYLYAACMRDNGYEMADPDFSLDGGPGSGLGAGGGGPFADVDFSDPAFVAANDACQDIFGSTFIPGGGGGGLGDGTGK
jgi:hypothetical protein